MDTASKTLTAPAVSVVMLTYNRAAFIREAIGSVLAQTFADWELIVIDDGSSDSTPDIIASFNDPRIRYVHHEENKGLAVRRPESATYVRGKFVAVLDSDDVWTDKEKLAKQVRFLEAHSDHALVGTFITEIGSDGHLLRKVRYAADDTAIRSRLLLKNQFAHSSVLMRASSLAEAGGYAPLPLAEDYDLFLRLGAIGKLANIPEYLTAYRLHGQSGRARKLGMTRAVHSLIKKYKNRYPRYLPALIFSYIRLLRAYAG